MDKYLCVDIGTASIKAVEKDASGDILRWGILERRGRPFHTTIQPLDEEDAAKNLSALLKKMGAESRKVVASVPAFWAFTATASAVDSSIIPAAPSTFELASIRLNDQLFFLYAAPKDVVEKYQKIFELAGRDLIRLELESVALAKTLGSNEDRVLIVDLGQRSTTYTIAENGKPVYVAQTDFAAASGAKDVIMKEAEKIARWKMTKRVIFSGGQSGAFDVVYGL